MLIVGFIALIETRRDTWQRAEQSSTNLVTALEHDIARNIELYDLSLQGAARIYNMRGLDKVAPDIRKAALFDSAAGAKFLGSLLILDKHGDIAESPAPVPRRINLADRDFFIAQAARPDAGLFVSRPFHNRVRAGEPSIAFSRRLSTPDGSFDGIAVGALRLAYFDDLFSRLNLGPASSVNLLRADGYMLARQPAIPAGADLDISKSAIFASMSRAGSGEFVAPGMVDSVKRLYVFRRMAGLPLIVSVNISVRDIYADWWPKALIIAGIQIVSCLVALLLGFLFRRELHRRLAAESQLRDSYEQMAKMAATDSLTQLANRGKFEERLTQEWQRAMRNETPLVLLLLDADCFKLYNDRYGHRSGDTVLKTVARCINANLSRPGDLGARYGGEEFAVLLPETTIASARQIAERIRADMEASNIEHLGAPSGKATLSVGVAARRPMPGDNEDMLVKAADKALYDAKHAGRNTVRISFPRVSHLRLAIGGE
jgi:diguanylate cyclase (GGDEF)-like protein